MKLCKTILSKEPVRTIPVPAAGFCPNMEYNATTTSHDKEPYHSVFNGA